MYIELFFSAFHVYNVSIPVSEPDCNFSYGNLVMEHC